MIHTLLILTSLSLPPLYPDQPPDGYQSQRMKEIGIEKYIEEWREENRSGMKRKNKQWALHNEHQVIWQDAEYRKLLCDGQVNKHHILIVQKDNPGKSWENLEILRECLDLTDYYKWKYNKSEEKYKEYWLGKWKKLATEKQLKEFETNQGFFEPIKSQSNK